MGGWWSVETRSVLSQLAAGNAREEVLVLQKRGGTRVVMAMGITPSGVSGVSCFLGSGMMKFR